MGLGVQDNRDVDEEGSENTVEAGENVGFVAEDQEDVGMGCAIIEEAEYVETEGAVVEKDGDAEGFSLGCF